VQRVCVVKRLQKPVTCQPAVPQDPGQLGMAAAAAQRECCWIGALWHSLFKTYMHSVYTAGTAQSILQLLHSLNSRHPAAVLRANTANIAPSCVVTRGIAH
jgi:hypothetical protein